MGKRKAGLFFGAALLAFIAAVAVLLSLNIRKLHDTGRVYEEIRSGEGTENELAAMAEKNPDVIGYLTVEDTMISCVIVQGEDNLTYLGKAADESASFAGTPFLDYRNSADFTDPYSVIYGHLVEDRLMFGDLKLFEDPDFWENERTGSLTLKDGTAYEIRFVAYLRADSKDSRIFDPIRARNNWKQEFLDGIAADFLIGEEQIVPEDRILALSTCSSYESEERIVILGKLYRTEG